MTTVMIHRTSDNQQGLDSHLLPQMLRTNPEIGIGMYNGKLTYSTPVETTPPE